VTVIQFVVVTVLAAAATEIAGFREAGTRRGTHRKLKIKLIVLIRK